MSDELRVTAQMVYSSDPKNTQVVFITVAGKRHVQWFGSNTPVTLHGHLVRELNWIVADWQASRRNAGGSDEQG